MVEYASQQPVTIVEFDITHEEMLGLIPNDVDTKFCKRHIDTHDIATINKHLANQQKQHMGEDEKPVAAEDINLDVPQEKEEEIFKMLQKHERMWSSQLGEINVTKMRIDIVPDAKSFKSAPCSTGTKTREF